MRVTKTLASTEPPLSDAAEEVPPVERTNRPALGAFLRRFLSFPVFLGALLVAGVFLNLCVRLQNDASLPTGYWHASYAGATRRAHSPALAGECRPVPRAASRFTAYEQHLLK